MTQLGPDEQTGRRSDVDGFDEFDQRLAGERAEEVKPGRRTRQWIGLGF